MRPVIRVAGFALLLITGSPLATAQSTDPAAEQGTLVTAEELEGEALQDIQAVRVVDVEQLLNSTRAEGTRQALEESDPAAIREFLKRETEVSKKIADALREAGVSEDEVAALVRYEDKQLIILYQRDS
jgi:hypothetical protein